jgi:hypothetical protein
MRYSMSRKEKWKEERRKKQEKMIMKSLSASLFIRG